MAEARRTTATLESAAGARFLIVEARFYDTICDLLLEGAIAALEQAAAVFDVITVPGALEIPTAIKIALEGSDDGTLYHGVIALGCVIRGETYHFEIVAGESSRALLDLAVARRLPFGNGILTVENEAQAIERADPARGDKGGDAARAAIALAALTRKVGRAR